MLFVLFRYFRSVCLDVFSGLCQAIDRIMAGQSPDAYEWHERIKHWYSWDWVARHTEIVYDHVQCDKQITLRERVQRYVSDSSSCHTLDHCQYYQPFRYQTCGLISGFVMSVVLLMAHLIFVYLDYIQPRRCIDLAIDYRQDHFESRD
jgi:hypothetical protein